MHLQAMLLLVHGLGHPLKESSFVEFGGGLTVDGEVAEGGAVVGAFAEGGFGEVVVVGGAEEEDTFANDQKYGVSSRLKRSW